MYLTKEEECMRNTANEPLRRNQRIRRVDMGGGEVGESEDSDKGTGGGGEVSGRTPGGRGSGKGLLAGVTWAGHPGRSGMDNGERRGDGAQERENGVHCEK